MAVAMVPGPASTGMASGVMAMSFCELSTSLPDSDGICLGCDTREFSPCNMRKPTMAINTPPATRNAGRVIPNNENTSGPNSAKVSTMKKAVRTARQATWRVVATPISAVSPRKMTALATGFIMARKAMNAVRA